jgi:hypothetical protein
MKRPTYLLLVALTLVSCSRRSGQLNLNTQGSGSSTPVVASDCPSGLSATISLTDPRQSSLIVGQNIQFQVMATGCNYDYMLYVQGQATPVRFSGITTYSQTYSMPLPNVQSSATVVALNAKGQPVAQFIALSPSFAVNPAPQVLSCQVSPTTVTVNVPVNSNNQPELSGPPSFSLTVNSSIAAKIISYAAPSENYLTLSSSTPIPGNAFRTSTTVSGTLRKLSGGSVEYTMQTEAGTTNRCSGTINFAFIPIQPGQPAPQFLFRGDVTGDGSPDIISWENTQKVFWLAKSVPGGTFVYENFGSLPQDTLTNAFLADFNTDGKFDILVRVSGSRIWKLGFSNGTQFVFANVGTWPVEAPELVNLALLDVNGDSRLDVVGTAADVSYVSYLTINGLSGTLAAPVPRAPNLNLTASSTNVAYNGSSTLNWSSNNTASCRLIQNGTQVTLPNGTNTAGTYTASALRSTQDFILRCSQAVTNTEFSSGAVRVTVGEPPAASLDLRVKRSASDNAADASIVTLGSSVHLRWSAVNVNSCSLLRNNASMSNLLNSAYIAQTINAQTTFKLECVSLTGTLAVTPVITVQVAGTVNFNPATEIDFQTVYFGQTSAPQKVVLTNPTGRAPITAALMSIPAGFEFAPGTCTAAVTTPFVLNGGASCDYFVKFAPTKLGNEVSRTYLLPLTIRYNNGLSEIVFPGVTLKGKGSDAPKGKP